MIRFACPSCSSTFTVTDDKAGKTSNCPKCKAQFVIPGGEAPPPLPPPPIPPVPKKNAPITIDPCPKCRTQLSVDPADLGTDVECPTCQTVFRAKKPGTGTKPSLPAAPVTRSRIDDDEPVRRRSRDDEDDDRPKRRPSSRRDDDDDRPRRSSRRNADDDDDRPRRSRRDDDFDDDYDRPRRPARRRSGTNEGQGVRVTSAVFGFIIGGLTLLCGVAIMVAGGVVMDALTGVGRTVATAPPPTTTRPGFGAPNNPNANAQAGAAIAGAGWLTGSMVIGCGLIAVLAAVVYIVGAIGLLQLRLYGKILTIIAAVLSSISILLGLYGMITSMGNVSAIGILINLITLAVYSAHAVTSFMACFGPGSHNIR